MFIGSIILKCKIYTYFVDTISHYRLILKIKFIYYYLI
jgi:hypothetical protein